MTRSPASSAWKDLSSILEFGIKVFSEKAREAGIDPHEVAVYLQPMSIMAAGAAGKAMFANAPCAAPPVSPRSHLRVVSP